MVESCCLSVAGKGAGPLNPEMRRYSAFGDWNLRLYFYLPDHRACLY